MMVFFHCLWVWKGYIANVADMSARHDMRFEPTGWLSATSRRMSRVGCVGRPCTYVRVTVRRDYIISREDEHAAAPMMGDPYMPGFRS